MNYFERWSAWSEEMDRKLAWPFHPAFFLGVAAVFGVGLLLGFWTGVEQSKSAAIAIFGAFIACCGIITIGRPMIRVGGYKEWQRRSRSFDCGEDPPTEKDLVEAKEQDKDALAFQLIGPALALVGTMTNGLSGLF